MRISVKDFSLERTLTAGQTFAWRYDSGWWYRFVDKPIAVRQVSESDLEFIGGGEEEIRRLLGLSDPIEEIIRSIDKDEAIHSAIMTSPGLRVVQDGLWPSLLGFVLSIQSNIPLLNRRIDALSKAYGNVESFNGVELSSFPSYKRILSSGRESLKQFRLGFRDRFVFEAAEAMERIGSDSVDTQELRASLKEIMGVGDKVFDCVLLYGLHDLSAFPIDVWIRRVLERHYKNVIGDSKSYKAIREKIVDYFGKYAGYAQLYMFDYIRKTSRRAIKI